MHTKDNQNHRYPLMILEAHLDSFGHVNHATYLQLFEEARWDLVTAKGFGLEHILETGLGPIILKVEMRFRRELRLRQKIVIETSLKSYSKKLANIYQEMLDENGEVYCAADILFGLFDLKTRKIVHPTPMWLYAIGVQGKPEV